MKANGTRQRHSRRRRITASAIILLIPVLRIVLGTREPVYHGLPASEYVRSVLKTNYLNVPVTTRLFEPLGTNAAVNALTKVLEQEDARWKHWYNKVLPRAPLWIRKRQKPVPVDQNLIVAAAGSLGYYGLAAGPAVPALIRSFNQNRDFVQWQIATQLRRIGSAAKDAIPTLLDTAVPSGRNSGNTGTRVAAIWALANIDPDGESTAQKLLPLCHDTTVVIATAATDAMGTMAERIPSLLPTLHDSLKHPQLPVCLAAARHLKRLGALTREDIIPFVNQLQSDNSTNRALGASVLAFAQQFDSDVVPALLRTAAETNRAVREAACKSLIKFFDDSDVKNSHRSAAIKGVVRFGSPEDTYPTLTNLFKLTSAIFDIVPILTAALENDSERVRGRAAQMLGEHKPAAVEALPALRRLMTDEWLNVRVAATNAIRSIESREQ